MDLAEFIAGRRPSWLDLEARLDAADRDGLTHLDVEAVRALGRLYREASADLLRARSRLGSAELVDYLNDLVARAHARIHPGRRPDPRAAARFLTRGFPALVRREARPVALATALFLLGGLFGAGAMAVDPDAWIYLLPEQHQHLDPDARVARDSEGQVMDPGAQAAFGSFLFTHNIQVTFLVFAVGILAGLLTAVVLFYNGVGLGALAWAYHVKGHDLFFWAWILPHGVLELSAIFIAGGAGFVLGRAILAPGRLARGDALRDAAGRAVRLVVGTAPILVVAGLVEGSLSQWHAPVVSPWIKLAFAAVAGSLLWLWLLRGGRDALTPAAG